MSGYIKISFAVLAACMLVTFLRETKKEFALILSLFCGVCAVLAVLPEVKAVFDILGEYSLLSQNDMIYFKILLKSVGISVICELTKELCLDSGNRFLASCADFAARTAITVLSIPLLSGVIKTVIDYIGK